MVRLNSEHFIYKAHFPGNPITPGVCILQMAQELISMAVGEKLAVRRVKNVKFLKILVPDKTGAIVFQLRDVSRIDDTVSARVLIVADDNLTAKISMSCQIAP